MKDDDLVSPKEDDDRKLPVLPLSSVDALESEEGLSLSEPLSYAMVVDVSGAELVLLCGVVNSGAARRRRLGMSVSIMYLKARVHKKHEPVFHRNQARTLTKENQNQMI